jgi:hypothetical protein
MISRRELRGPTPTNSELAVQRPQSWTTVANLESLCDSGCFPLCLCLLIRSREGLSLGLTFL